MPGQQKHTSPISSTCGKGRLHLIRTFALSDAIMDPAEELVWREAEKETFLLRAVGLRYKNKRLSEVV